MKSILLGVKLLCSLLCMMILYGCNDDLFTEFNFEESYSSSNSFLFDEQYERVVNSWEYNNYQMAQKEFINVFVLLDSSKMIYVDSLNMYKLSFRKEKKALEEATAILVRKYPEFLMVENNAHRQSKIALTRDGDFIDRSKCNHPESMAHQILPKQKTIKNGRFNVLPFVSSFEAYQACVEYSHDNNVESGGYVFSDYSSIFAIDNQATHSTMQLPGFNWPNEELTPIHAYHHHFHSPRLAHQDSITQEELGFPLHVIYDDAIYIR